MSWVTGREAGMPALLNAATTVVPTFHPLSSLRPLVCSSKLWIVTDAYPVVAGVA